MNARHGSMIAFLERAGWGSAALAPLAGDASARRYLRLDSGDAKAVLMDAPPDAGEDIRPFVRMTTWLRDHGLSAPDLLAKDEEAGFLLLEDLGDSLFARHAQVHPAEENALYARATDLLVQLSELAPAADLAAYDQSVLQREADLFVDWWLPSAADNASQWQAEDFSALLAASVAPVCDARDVTVLRDYHAENLLWLPERLGNSAVGLLDYQDALSGHPAYDLVSLLEDARRDTSSALRSDMIGRYLRARPDLDREAFLRDYAILGAQRNLKIIGIFARLARRDGKPRYLDLIPRVWAHLLRDLSHPHLKELSDWVGAHVPEPTPEILKKVAG